MLNRGPANRHKHGRGRRSPDFDSGIISEPLLQFGGRHEHVDPKTGLALYGPYSLAGQARPSLTSIAVGVVGTAPLVANTRQWLDACKGVLTNDGSHPLLYPHFPGFNCEYPFQSELLCADTWQEVIRQRDLESALNESNFFERIKRVISLYIGGIETLSQRDPRPHVILCCIPQEVIDYCTVRVTRGGTTKRVRVSKAERQMEEAARRGQLFLLPEMDPTLGIEDDEGGHQNLRRGLKAEAMQFGIPTQLVWPSTLELTDRERAPGERRRQDVATRAWNLMTALYHKAGGSPWRLADVEPGVCFLGISFYQELRETDPRMRTSMAQAFTAAGDGYVLRGSPFEWDASKNGNSPHLDEKAAATLMRDVLDLYQRQNRGSLPTRLVVHKTSRYWEEELVGFRDACQYVPRADFVTLGRRGIQFYRTGDYPPIRGTYAKFSDTDLIFYTDGYIPYLLTYPGPRVPQPLEIMEHYGDCPWNTILEEVLALTKMNWNTADFSCSQPITIAFSQKVGQILAELPPHLPVRPEYRFYM